MACERRFEALSRDAAGESAGAELQRHLEGCAPCRAQLESARRALAAVDATLGELARLRPGPGFEQRVLRAAEMQRAPTAPWLRWAAAVGLVTAGLLVWTHLAPGELGVEQGAPVATLGEQRAADDGVRHEASGRMAADGGVAEAEAAPESDRVVGRRRATAAGARRAQAGPGEVLVPPGQLEALVLYARLRTDGPGVLPGAPLAPPVALGADPIRIVPLSIEPLSLDAEGASR